MIGLERIKRRYRCLYSMALEGCIILAREKYGNEANVTFLEDEARKYLEARLQDAELQGD